MLHYFSPRDIPLVSEQYPVFPIEIFQVILQHLLAQHSASDVITCSLVDISDIRCQQVTKRRRLLGHLRRHPKLYKLVRHVTYHPDGPEIEAPDSLSKFLFLPMLQSLDVGVSTCPNLYFTLTKEHPRFGISALISTYISIGTLTSLSLSAISMLPLFSILSSPNLQCLTMTRCEYDPAEWDANQQSIVDRDMMFSLVVFWSICSTVPSFIDRCPHLRDMGILSFSPLGLSRVYPASLAGLEELTLDTYSLLHCFEGLKESKGTAVMLPRLRRLKLHVGFPLADYAPVRRMINKIVRHAPHLDELCIEGSQHVALQAPDIQKHIDLPICFSISRATLRRFEFQWQASFEDDVGIQVDRTFHQLCGWLESYSHLNNVLRNIRLAVNIPAEQMEYLATCERGFPNPFRGWDALHSLLNSKDAQVFPLLQEVQVQVDITLTKETFRHLECQFWNDSLIFLFGALDDTFAARTRKVDDDASRWLSGLLRDSLHELYDDPKIFFSCSVRAHVLSI